MNAWGDAVEVVTPAKAGVQTLDSLAAARINRGLLLVVCRQRSLFGDKAFQLVEGIDGLVQAECGLGLPPGPALKGYNQFMTIAQLVQDAVVGNYAASGIDCLDQEGLVVIDLHADALYRIVMPEYAHGAGRFRLALQPGDPQYRGRVIDFVTIVFVDLAIGFCLALRY